MQTVLVVFGGRSVEHDISIITGQFIISALKAAGKYKVVPLYITRDGGWYSEDFLADLKSFRDSGLGERLKKLRTVALNFEGGLSLVTSGLRSRSQGVDMVFPALHGTNGEDGSLMGLLRMANVPFVGCGLGASVVAMDKVLTKQVTAGAGVPSVPFVWLEAGEGSSPEAKKKLMKLSYPLFVKPAHLGSSIGITKVEKEADLDDAIELAFHYDNKVIVEQGVADLTELNCAVLGNEDIRTSLLEQPLTQTEFLSFKDKYLSGGKKGGSMSGAKDMVRIPAPVSDKVEKEVKDLAVKAFTAIGGSGTARLDFLLDNKTQQIYLNEINPLPGSLQQHLWKASGVSNVELVTELIELASERHAAEQKLTSSFDSSVLNQAAGNKAP